MPNSNKPEPPASSLPPLNLTVNVSGLLTPEALDLIVERVEELVAQAMDEARRMHTDVKR